jgi:hypothetical protein
MALGAMAIAGIAQGVSGLFGAFSAGKRKRRARRAQKKTDKAIAHLEANRQEIIDPFAGITDLSSTITNPFANLQVATQAAEFQSEQTDLSLASTLDTLRATGAGAGGATALAQEAAKGKQGVAATIEQQEIQNTRLRAQGESQLQQIKLGEQQRVQSARAQGKQFVFGQQDIRENQQLNRLSGKSEQYGAEIANAQTAQDTALGGLFGSVAAGAAAGAFSSKTPQ